MRLIRTRKSKIGVLLFCCFASLSTFAPVILQSQPAREQRLKNTVWVKYRDSPVDVRNSITQSDSASEFRIVARVVDGDTLVMENAKRIRLIGVDTPETKHPKKAVQYFGKDATAFTKRMAEGKRVRLEFDQLTPPRSQRSDTACRLGIKGKSWLKFI